MRTDTSHQPTNRAASNPANDPGERPRRRAPAATGWVLAVTVYAWLAATSLIAASLTRVRGRLKGQPQDEGSVLADAAMVVGLVLIAGLVLLALRGKATTITNNICTNADPSTC